MVKEMKRGVLLVDSGLAELASRVTFWIAFLGAVSYVVVEAARSRELAGDFEGARQIYLAGLLLVISAVPGRRARLTSFLGVVHVVIMVVLWWLSLQYYLGHGYWL